MACLKNENINAGILSPHFLFLHPDQFRDFFADDVGGVNDDLSRQVRVSVRNRVDVMPQQSRDDVVRISQRRRH